MPHWGFAWRALCGVGMRRAIAGRALDVHAVACSSSCVTAPDAAAAAAALDTHCNAHARTRAHKLTAHRQILCRLALKS
jgi:hypothetical protein